MKLLKNILLVLTVWFFVAGFSGKNKSVFVLPQNIGLMQQAVKNLDAIPSDYRAFPIKIDEATANAVRNCIDCMPEYKVDILAMFDRKLKDGKIEKAVGTILQNVEYNSHFEINGQNYLVLLLSPVEAQYMSLLAKNPVKIILRSFHDNKMLPLEMVNEKNFAKRYERERTFAPNKKYSLKINADTARHIESGDVVNIKIKENDNPVAKSVKILKSFSLNGDCFVSFNLNRIEAQYLFFAEAAKKKIYLSKSLNKEILKWIYPTQENSQAALALAEEYAILEDKLGADDAVSSLRKKYNFTREEWNDFYKQAYFMGLFEKAKEKIAADNKNSAFPPVPLHESEPAVELKSEMSQEEIAEASAGLAEEYVNIINKYLKDNPSATDRQKNKHAAQVLMEKYDFTQEEWEVFYEDASAEGLFEKAKEKVFKPTKAPAKKDTATKEANQASIERYKMGIRYYNQNDYNKAKEEFEAALKLDPNNADASVGLKRIEAIKQNK